MITFIASLLSCENCEGRENVRTKETSIKLVLLSKMYLVHLVLLFFLCQYIYCMVSKRYQK